ncbi:MAG: AI-2E family transporter, partial [Actinobacteria bacterium]|nr:AI-2E family transporter [Actinomycetota bacterium]
MANDENVPDTLRTLAGFTWRILVVVAGLVLVLYIFNTIFPVMCALFFALLVTAWTQPVMNLYHKIMPKVLALVLALITIMALVVVILGTVVKSSIAEGPKLVDSIGAGLNDVEGWLKTGPLGLSNDQFSSLITNLQNWGTSILKGIAGDAFGALGSIGTLIIAGSVFIFGVIFFLMAPQTIWGWLMNWIPKNLRTHIDVSGRIAWDSIAGYTRGIVVIAFLDA